MLLGGVTCTSYHFLPPFCSLPRADSLAVWFVCLDLPGGLALHRLTGPRKDLFCGHCPLPHSSLGKGQGGQAAVAFRKGLSRVGFPQFKDLRTWCQGLIRYMGSQAGEDSGGGRTGEGAGLLLRGCPPVLHSLLRGPCWALLPHRQGERSQRQCPAPSHSHR